MILEKELKILQAREELSKILEMKIIISKTFRGKKKRLQRDISEIGLIDRGYIKKDWDRLSTRSKSADHVRKSQMNNSITSHDKTENDETISLNLNNDNKNGQEDSNNDDNNNNTHENDDNNNDDDSNNDDNYGNKESNNTHDMIKSKSKDVHDKPLWVSNTAFNTTSFSQILDINSDKGQFHSKRDQEAIRPERRRKIRLNKIKRGERIKEKRRDEEDREIAAHAKKESSLRIENIVDERFDLGIAHQ